ncbi:hypothetical protein [Gellertiella hungarica]|uniref:Antifreeze protein n=1 Tax=Gellertiella hungarica TaxID=1572859 RepID=A0A7W6NJ74_9HYPH|nr:hypothetical protein [Gellertiella hungarica]MBB4063458.1 hypothetical protein [Gellertiella hungarica]
MKKLFARMGLATLIAGATLAGLAPAAAQADDFGIEFRFGGDDGYNREYRHHRWNNRYEGRRGCRPDRALEIARYEGLRRAHISRVTPRVVVVKGRGPYGWERIVFANVRGCPIVDR